MVIKVSTVHENGSEHDAFLGRLTRAMDDKKTSVSRDIPYDAVLRRGVSRHVLRHQSLSERDGDSN